MLVSSRFFGRHAFARPSEPIQKNPLATDRGVGFYILLLIVLVTDPWPASSVRSEPRRGVLRAPGKVVWGPTARVSGCCPEISEARHGICQERSRKLLHGWDVCRR